MYIVDGVVGGCRVQWNREFVPVQWEESHWPWSEIEAVSAVPQDKAVALAAWRQPGHCPWIPYIWSERKNFVRKAGERYKHREEKSGSVALKPMEIPPLYRIWHTSPAYLCSSTSSWPMSRLYPVLCLDALSRLGKWAPGGIITFIIIPGIFYLTRFSWLNSNSLPNAILPNKNYSSLHRANIDYNY